MNISRIFRIFFRFLLKNFVSDSIIYSVEQYREVKIGLETLEYIIKQKNEGKVLIKKICAVLCYVLLFAVLAWVIGSFSAPLLQIPFLLVDVIFCAMIAFVSWRFLCVEYELVFSGGEMTATVIYGRSIRKRVMSVAINALIEVGIYDDGAYERLSGMSLQKNFIYVSSMSAETIYYAIFDDGKDRCVVYFETDERAIKLIKQSNSGAVRAGNTK